MDTFARLKAEAAAKRNAAIDLARLEFRQSLAKIDELRRRLGTKGTKIDPKRRIIVDLIEETIPRDRPFSVAECIAGLKRADSQRIFFEATVRADLQKLIRRGVIRRVRRQGGTILFAAAEWKGPKTEFGAQSTSTVAEKLLLERGPMTAVELVVVMRERNFRSADDPRRIKESLIQRLRCNPDRFTMDEAGRWSLVK